MAGLTGLLLALLLALTGPALGHGGLANYTTIGPDGKEIWYRGWDPFENHDEQAGQPWMVQRRWDTIDPVFSVTAPALACNTPGTAAISYIPIKAGQNITAVYWYWLHPYGPMSTWLAACGADCNNVDVNELDWFKIWDAGIVRDANLGLAGAMWYQRDFQKWDGSPDRWPVTIPATLKPGLYLIRHEILSIHVANKPQFYPQCANLNITGTGTTLPSPEFYKKFPGAYALDDPAVYIDIYTNKTTSYAPPGGPVWTGAEVVDKYCQGC